ncbi:MAG: hypothetical protein PHV82_13450 [Victivallaceae bacterium]|nr:hypothetical protein [Victivallaceae bacterium]
MSLVDDMRKLTEEIISSYEERISSVGMIIDNTHRMLDEFKSQRNLMSGRLKNKLSHEETLRKKDFDVMMADILAPQEEREKEIRNSLQSYLEEQKSAAGVIRTNLKKHAEAKDKDGEDVVGNFRSVLLELQNRRQERENEVYRLLNDFRNEHQATTRAMRELLRNGRAIRIHDLKIKIKNIRQQLTQNRDDIHQISSQWHEMSRILAEKRLARQGA